MAHVVDQAPNECPAVGLNMIKQLLMIDVGDNVDDKEWKRSAPRIVGVKELQ